MRTLNRAIGRRRKAVYADRIEKFTPGSIMLLIFVCISLRRRLQNLAIRKFQFGQIHRNDALNIRPIITLQHGDGRYPKRIVADQLPESIDQADARQRVDFVHGCQGIRQRFIHDTHAKQASSNPHGNVQALK